MAQAHIKDRVSKHRAGLRDAGLRPIQLWVPDTRRPDFEAQCRAQAILVAKADQTDQHINMLLDTALADLDGWNA